MDAYNKPGVFLSLKRSFVHCLPFLETPASDCIIGYYIKICNINSVWCKQDTGMKTSGRTLPLTILSIKLTHIPLLVLRLKSNPIWTRDQKNYNDQTKSKTSGSQKRNLSK